MAFLGATYFFYNWAVFGLDYFYASRNLVYSYSYISHTITQFIRQVVNAQECQHRDEHCKSSVFITIMSWHMHKNIGMQAVNLYDEFAWAQENFDVGG